MQIGLIGVGKMGTNLALNYLSNGSEIIIYDKSPEAVENVVHHGGIGTYSLEDFVRSLKEPRIIWIMVNAGQPVDEIIESLLPYLTKGDIIIDGGNSYYKDSMKRYEFLKNNGVDFLDVGTSGGVRGARDGACLMVGGEEEVFRKVEFVFNALATTDGYKLVGKSGAGHFVKGIHNFVEYGLLGAIAEGAEMLELIGKKEDLMINLQEVFELWNNGSICESKLLNDAIIALKKFPDINRMDGRVFGETHREMETILNLGKENGIQTLVIEASIKERIDSQYNPTYKGRIINAIRNIFGGH